MSIAADQRSQSRDPLLAGVVVMTTFGLGWSVVGIGGLPLSRAGMVLLIGLAALIAVGVYVAAHRLHATSSTPDAAERQVAPNVGRIYFWVNIGQAIAIAAAVVAFNGLDAIGLIPPTVCLVVGLHFLPLARSFDTPLYWWTAGLLTLVAVTGAVGYAAGLGNGWIVMIVGFPAAVVLWATSLRLAQTA
jgi:hypothetical protein